MAWSRDSLTQDLLRGAGRVNGAGIEEINAGFHADIDQAGGAAVGRVAKHDQLSPLNTEGASGGRFLERDGKASGWTFSRFQEHKDPQRSEMPRRR